MAAKEAVLIIGATGNIGVSAVIGALNTGRSVLAIVRNQNSAEKLSKHVGTKGITTVEADITSDNGVQSVVEQVRANKLPAFQHVYSAAGGEYSGTPLKELGTEELNKAMNINFETNFFAYRATVPYLLEQNNANSTWTLCTGAQGDIGLRAAPAISQGALFSMANAACRENAKTNVRFNEVYLAARVEVDRDAEKSGVIKASEFAKVYEQLLSRPDIRSSRISVHGRGDLNDLKHKSKLNWPN